MAYRRKAGRKRKPGTRTPSGRLSRGHSATARDNGTPELAAHRKALVGPDADPVLSASASGILLAHGIITREHYNQAAIYRRLRCAVFGPPWPSNATTTEATEKQLLGWRCKLEALERCITQEQRHTVAQVAVFDVVPAHYHERDLLLTALDALAERGTSQSAAA